MPNAVVLLSGGIDSTTTAALAAEQGFALYALSFAYGQRHGIELVAARGVAEALNVKRHVLQSVDLRVFGGSALTDEIDVPMDRDDDRMAAEIPITYVPARNTIFLAHALAFAETIGAFDIFIGANVVDYSGYPDCRPEFIAKFQELANLATSAAVEGQGRFRVHAPLIEMSKADIIREGVRLGLDYGLTHSCYAPTAEGLACGRCDSCLLRKKGFDEAGVSDPTRYA
ncbi:MAG: 7-cyano-7-deazaguanine synthase QueC [Phycisphaerae bacterium]